MPRMIDVKPKAGLMINVKPKVTDMIDIKPKVGVIHEVQNRGYSVTLARGQYIGLPFLLTYRDAGTVTQWSEVG